MGVFSSVIVKMVVAGTFAGGLASAGLLFVGEEKLEDASNFVNNAKNKIVQYEVSENSLLEKLGLVQSQANGKINAANEIITDKNAEIAEQMQMITDLSGKKAQLETEIEGLQGDISELQASLNQANADHEVTKGLLAEKSAQYDAKVKELKVANDRIAEYIRLAQIAYEKAQEADRHIAQLETEVQNANAAVNAHDAVVDQAKAETQDKAPMSNEELDTVDTSTEEVIAE